MRAVLDPNVIISGLLSPNGSPARILLAFSRGEFELVASPALLDELARALAYPKLRRRIAADEAASVVAWLRRAATIAIDPSIAPAVRSADPGDDYLLALAAAENTVLVSGDRHLLSLRRSAPISSPAEFLELLEEA